MKFVRSLFSGSGYKWHARSHIRSLSTLERDANEPKLRTWSWGDGTEAKLGHGSEDSLKTPTPIRALDGLRVTSLSAGVNHTVAIVQSPNPPVTGLTFGWGSNFYGAAGHVSEEKGALTALFTSEDEDADVIDSPSPVSVLTRSDILEPGEIQSSEAGLGGQDVVEIACGDFHSVALTREGTVYSWGAGLAGNGSELYDSQPSPVELFPTIGRKVVRACASGSMTIALAEPLSTLGNLNRREVFLWGYVRHAQSQFVKALKPVIIAAAFRFEFISLIGSSRGAGIIVGSNAAQISSLQIIGTPFSGLEVHRPPESPPYWDCTECTEIYRHEPFVEIDIPLDCRDVKKVEIVDGRHILILLVDGSWRALDMKTKTLKFVNADISELTDFSVGTNAVLLLTESGQVLSCEKESFSLALAECRKLEFDTVFRGGVRCATSGWDHMVVGGECSA